MKKQVILDTNILLHCLQYKIDLEKELNRILPFQYEISILENTIKELNFLEQKKDPKARFLAKLAHHFIKTFEIKIIKMPENKTQKVDDILIQLANQNTIIATQDKEIKKAIKTPIIIIRSKNHLELQNYNNY